MEWILFLATGILTSGVGWFLLARRKRRAESWPMVAGRFEDGEVRGGELKYVAGLSYSYEAYGAYYAGFYEREFRMRRHAEDLVDLMRGQPVYVRYHPEKPEQSVIREQDNASLFVLR